MKSINKIVLLLVSLATTFVMVFSVNIVKAQEIDELQQEGYVRNKIDYHTYTQNEYGLYAGEAIHYKFGEVLVDEKKSNIIKEVKGETDVVKIEGANEAYTVRIDIPENGYYEIAFKYLVEQRSSNRVYFGLFVDNQLPFSEAQSLELKKGWVNAGEVIRDKYDNDIAPKQVPYTEWQTSELKNFEGKYSDDYQFYLTKGTHEITLYNRGSDFVVDEIILKSKDELVDYTTYEQTVNKEVYTGENIKIQGEEASVKSESLMYPYYDRTTPATQPSHPSKIRLNVIGGTAWSSPGTWIEWEIDVPETATYAITTKYRQNFSKGMAVSRRISIDGKVPFEELNEYKFNYTDKWALETLGKEGETYLFELEEGKHTLRMEVTLGELADTLRVLENCVFDLNNLYKDIVMYTGSNPDRLRDYALEQEIPGLMDRLEMIYQMLQDEYAQMQQLSNSLGNDITEITQMLMQLELFIKDSDNIITSLSSFNSNISALGMMLKNMRSKPMEIDYLELHAIGAKLEKPAASFFEQLAYDTSAFFASFTEQYNAIGSEEQGAIEVWASTGRDQASALRNLIDEDFTPKTGIPVNLSIVDTGSTLIQATLAGKGPDIALMIDKESPINLAMRGGLQELSEFEGYEEVQQRFFPSAFIPYEYDGGIYAIPETQSYNMMFYRKDIFEQLGLKVPNTWDEFYEVVLTLQKSKLQAGIVEDQYGFEMMLFQRGMSFYNEDRSMTNFDSQEALDAFKQWTELYVEYGLDRTFDFYNRFRSGEMPIAIQPYTMYNQITVAAPELQGLWDMVPIPGRLQEDGTINRAEGSIGKATVMIKGASDPEKAFEFMKWWASSEVITKYANELEMVMGPAARYETANIEAFDNLPWEERQKQYLMEQWEQVTDFPQIPGNYYIKRNISNAFRRVVDKNENPRETLSRYNKEINAEITRKRIEFGLE